MCEGSSQLAAWLFGGCRNKPMFAHSSTKAVRPSWSVQLPSNCLTFSPPSVPVSPAFAKYALAQGSTPFIGDCPRASRWPVKPILLHMALRCFACSYPQCSAMSQREEGSLCTHSCLDCCLACKSARGQPTGRGVHAGGHVHGTLTSLKACTLCPLQGSTQRRAPTCGTLSAG